MMTKTTDLIGAALDWAVAKCEGSAYHGPAWTKYSTDWSQGGPIIEKEWLDVTPWPNESREDMRWHCQQHNSGGDYAQYGPTPLIAAMRCYVASKFGDEIDVPNELI
jgi:hypothetical protein